MKTRALLLAAAILVSSPVDAATFLVTYKGTLASGFDEFGAFGLLGADLSGSEFEAIFTLTSPLAGSIVQNTSNSTTIYGGSNYGAASPVSGLIRVNGVNYIVGGGNLGRAYQSEGSLGGADRLIHQSAESDQDSSFYLSASVFSYQNSIVTGVDLTSPISYILTPDDGYGGSFSLFSEKPSKRANVQGVMRISSVSISELGATAVPEPATWATMLIGFGLIGGALRYRRRSSRLSLIVGTQVL